MVFSSKENEDVMADMLSGEELCFTVVTGGVRSLSCISTAAVGKLVGKREKVVLLIH
jgi:hypothetical protein